MDLPRLAVRASILGAIAAAVVLFLVLGLRRVAPPEQPDAPASATVR
jgi:hypothetical protein